MPLAATFADSAAGLLTAMAGLVGACVAAYKLLKPSPPAEEEEGPVDAPAHPMTVQDELHAHISDLRSSLADCRATVLALRGRLDRATLGGSSMDRGPGPNPPTDWLSR